jgi:hypothetical protein
MIQRSLSDAGVTWVDLPLVRPDVSGCSIEQREAILEAARQVLGPVMDGDEWSPGFSSLEYLLLAETVWLVNPSRGGYAVQMLTALAESAYKQESDERQQLHSQIRRRHFHGLVFSAFRDVVESAQQGTELDEGNFQFLLMQGLNGLAEQLNIEVGEEGEEPNFPFMFETFARLLECAQSINLLLLSLNHRIPGPVRDAFHHLRYQIIQQLGQICKQHQSTFLDLNSALLDELVTLTALHTFVDGLLLGDSESDARVNELLMRTIRSNGSLLARFLLLQRPMSSEAWNIHHLSALSLALTSNPYWAKLFDNMVQHNNSRELGEGFPDSLIFSMFITE